MALLFMEGFEWQTPTSAAGVAADERVMEAESSSSFLRTATGGRIDGSKLRIGTTANARLRYKIPTTNDTFYIGFAIQIDTLNAAEILAFYDDSTEQISLEITATGAMRVLRGATVLGTTSNGVIAGTLAWFYVVLKVKISNTVGTVELWVDGVKELNLTSQDTQDSANASINNFFIYENGGNYAYFDDIYLGDTSGTDMTDQVGDCHIELVSPDANGTTNNWTRSSGTNNYEMVDEINTDGDTTYVSSSTVTDKELYGCNAITGSAGTIQAIAIQAHVRKEDAGYRELKTVCRSNVTEVDGAAQAINVTYTSIHEIYENNPDGGGNWTESAVNAMEVGFKIFA